MRHLLLIIYLFICFSEIEAQETFHLNGVVDKRPEVYAFTNATLYQDYETIINDAILIVEKGLVKAVGTNIDIPKGAITIDLKGKYIYPAFIDAYTNYGLSNFDPNHKTSSKPQYESNREQAYGWNDNIKSDFNAVDAFIPNPKEAIEWKKNGFGVVNSFRKSGLARGTSTLVTLADLPVNELIINGKAAALYSFVKGNTTQNYPNSIMGSVALIRQTYYDGKWYEENQDVEYNMTLEAFNSNLKLPQIFEASGDKLRVLLADKIGDEFDVQYIVKGNGDEYQRVDAIKATEAHFILPINFPDAYDVSDPYDAVEVTLAEMKHWELAPYNAKILNQNGISFALTTYGMKSKSDFWKTLRTLKNTGLSEKNILKALTVTPARYLNATDQIGALKTGLFANFFITSSNLFESDSEIVETWVQGKRDQFKILDEPNLAGKYDLTFNDQSFNLELVNLPSSHSAFIFNKDSTITSVELKIEDKNILFSFKSKETYYRLKGWIGVGEFGGYGESSNAANFSWKAALKQAIKPDKNSDTQRVKNEVLSNIDYVSSQLIYPFVSHGWAEKPKQDNLLIKNATVWDMVADSALNNTDVLVKEGKIVAIGKNIEAEAKTIDGTGKHLSPGIIDEHSHIALSAVNESTASITAEVRMYDAVNSEDINIYRNLAGGVVAAQLLHGSANAVGGQSAIVKYRWGLTPEEMKIKDADGFIKFALGENVKQSNWGDENTIRFPQTRMGVEQVYINGFTEAKAYGEKLDNYSKLNKKTKLKSVAPRRDLRLESLLEVVNSDRFITCHSYVQSEINMLMKVADKFDFRVNTFTHILEGYKVADKMKVHGAGASTFSDWWAYKFEVKDAIPYNASIMQDVGLTVAINSDNAEMSRRLNQEAAKSIKYGGMSEMNAMKMVTLNPAKLLHLDHRMGTIEVGKDADLVLWSDHPLSIYAKAEYTLIDGIIYYSLKKDKETRAYIKNERTRLINKMIEAKAGGAMTQKATAKEMHLLHCDSEETGFIQTDLNNE